MARLAVDTGGRYTEGINDLTLGYARAQRDLGCTYSVGFYDDKPEEDRIRNVSVRVRVPGLRAVHPSKYVLRSREAKLESRLLAAFLSPELFETGVVRAHVFSLHPESKSLWKGLLAVSFPVPLAETLGADATRQFGAVLYRGSKVLHRFSRTVTLRPDGPDVTSEPRITFLEPVELEPGAYELRVVMSDPEGESPHAAKLEVVVPEIPTRRLFLTGPILGKSAGMNVVVTGSGSVGGDTVGGMRSFEPLIVQQLDIPVDLVVLTEACIVGKNKRKRGARAEDVADGSVARSLRSSDGSPVGELPVQSIRPEGEGRVRCEHLVDQIPAVALEAGRYEFEAVLRSIDGKDDDHGRIRFSVGSSGEASRAGE